MNKLMLGICIAAAVSSNAMAQTCKTDSITLTHPAGQYSINEDGTVTDVVNGLMWRLCSTGQDHLDGNCTGSPTNYSTWEEALESSVTNEEFAGYNDWRLPNIKELGDLVERSCTSPAIDLASFPGTPSAVFWSNTPDVYGVNVEQGISGTIIDFTDGTEFLTDVNRLRVVRMVRKIEVD